MNGQVVRMGCTVLAAENFYEAALRHWIGGAILLYDLQMMLLAEMELLTILEPSCGLKLSKMKLPSILFGDHPERRYFKDNTYTKANAEDCRKAAYSLIKEMVRMRIDGYL